MRQSKPYKRLRSFDMKLYMYGHCVFVGYDAREGQRIPYEVYSEYSLHEMKIQAAENREYDYYRKLRNLEYSIEVVDNLIARLMLL